MFKSKFIEKVQLTPTDWSFRFEIPDGYEYKAGQYSVIRVNLAYPDTRSNARTCSFSSSPTEPYLQFSFTIRDTGFKKTLMEMESGTEVELTPARGKMVLEEVHTPHCVMIAGGVGVTPFRGIIKRVYDEQAWNTKITLLYSDKTLDELEFYSEFQEVETHCPQFRAIYTLTRHLQEHGDWKGKIGRIDTVFIKEYISDLEQCTFMVCGPVEMVQGAMVHLAAMNIPRERIISELFTGY